MLILQLVLDLRWQGLTARVRRRHGGLEVLRLVGVRLALLLCSWLELRDNSSIGLTKLLLRGLLVTHSVRLLKFCNKINSKLLP